MKQKKSYSGLEELCFIADSFFQGVVQFLVLGVLRSIFIFVPFAAFQAYGYHNICLGKKLDEVSPWCSARVPLLYNYIQSRYWYHLKPFCMVFFVLDLHCIKKTVFLHVKSIILQLLNILFN